MPRPVNVLSLLAASILIGANVAPALADELLLAFKADKATTFAKDVKGQMDEASKPKSETFTLGLGPAYFYIDAPDYKSIYRFDSKRIIGIDKKKLRYSDLSLYSQPGFREAELANRLVMADLLRSVGKEALGGDAADFEETFGLERPAHSLSSVVPKYTIVKSGGDTVQFQRAGKTRVELTNSANTLDADQQRSFRRYMAYLLPMHPEVRKYIADSAVVPQKLSILSANPPLCTTQTSLQLLNYAKSQTNNDRIPDSFSQSTPSGELGELLTLVAATKNKIDRNATIAAAAGARENGNRLDAMLILMEYGLSTGDQLVDEVRKLVPGSDSDEQFQLFIRGMGGADDSEQAKQELVSLNKIDRSKLSKSYELDIYRANCLSAIGQTQQARELFLKVLRINPLISGAWKDLGDVYYRSFDTPSAWICWDEARKLGPQNPLAHHIDGLEEHLRNSYPDFF